MAAIALGLPPDEIGTLPLPVRHIEPSKLLRVSRFSAGEPFFGRNPDGRFSSADGSYGSCYLGRTLKVAVAETILHDLVPQRGKFIVPASELTRYVWYFSGPDLVLADMTGTHLKRLGAHGEISTTTDYDTTQAWAKALHCHPQNVDGLLYVSRHVNTDLAVVLFDRAARKLVTTKHESLIQHRSFKRTAAALGIQVATY